MRTAVLTLTLSLIMNTSFAQAEKTSYKIIADKFEANYNSSNYDSIFAMFSVEMQKALPSDKTVEFLEGVKIQAGQITQRQFIKYEQTYASYKTTFERAVFALNI